MAPSGACIVVPTYNEKENIAALLASVEGLKIPGLSVLVVDDSSPDGTAGIVRELSLSRPWILLMQREAKKGIGSAYQDGFRKAIADSNASVLLEMDADLQHPPSVIPALLKAVADGADVALGSRYVPGGGVAGWSWSRRTVSRGANAYARTLLGIDAKDATSGFRAYTRDAAGLVATTVLPAKGFEFQVASLHLLKRRAKVVEVPFVFVPRAAGKSKLNYRDMVRFFFAVIRLALFGRPAPAEGSKTEIRGTSGAV